MQYSTLGFMELLSGLANNSKVVLKHACTAEARLCVIAHWLVVLDTMPCGFSRFVRGWYLCIRWARSVMKSAEGVCLQCWEYSHAYLSLDKRVGDTAAPAGWCTPIM